MSSPENEQTFESFGARAGERNDTLLRIKEWVLIEGGRMSLAVGISFVVFFLLVGLNWGGVIAFVNDDSITRLAGGMIAGSLSLVTLVVSLNQLILSRQFKSAGEVRDQFTEVMAFRGDIEDASDIPATPAEPTKLLEVLVADIHDRASRLPETVSGHPDGRFTSMVREYVRHVEERTERIDETLERTKFGTFGALSAAIDYNDPWQFYVARHLRNQYAESMSADAQAEFDGLIDALQRFAVAREHFKTTYLQRELTRFSQLTILSGVPSVVAAILIGLVYADFTGATLDIVYMPYVTSALIAIVLFPLALLAAYILRTATISHRTASIGPMLPGKDPEEGPFNVEHGQQDTEQTN